MSLKGDKIAIIPIKGTIYSEGGFSLFQTSSSTGIINYIEEVDKKGDVKGVIFDIDSPGGSPYPCKEIAYRIKGMNKPKIALIGECGASGAYWIASSCDKIIADELSVLGSVGVASIRPDFSGFMEKIGIKVDTTTTGRYKGIGFPFKEQSEEEKDVIKKELDVIYKNFSGEVVKNRNLKADKIKDFFEGRVYLGKEAIEVGLIDYIGRKEKALEICKKEAGIDHAKIIDYNKIEMRESLLERMIKRLFK
jgi:protease-4